MDSNGLADPYVKLHLLPGASKVRLCLVWVWFWAGDGAEVSQSPLKSLPRVRHPPLDFSAQLLTAVILPQSYL